MTSRKRIALLAAGLVVTAGALAAVAAAQGHRGGWRSDHMMFGEAFGHGGMRGMFGRPLTKDEFDARTRERFARLDKNGDNVIDAAEIEGAINERMAARLNRWGGTERIGERLLRRMGAGADGKLTRDAFRTELTRRFVELDLNNDGRIDDNDLPPLMRGRQALSNARFGAFGPMRWLRLIGVEAKDGAISREDVLAAGDRQFDRLDRNKDGVVDKADMDALRKEMVDYRVKRFIHHFGADKDGRVTREQFQAKAAERFARMDLNSDGTVSRDELPGRGMRGWRHGGDGQQGMMGHRGGMGGGMMGHRGGMMGDHGGMSGGMMGPGGPNDADQAGEPPAKN
jgi:Ca2+-binding EF-hand superfamily protein